MPANLITRQVSAKVFMQILNMQPFRKLFQMLANEYVAEYEIRNNTLSVKLIDRIKLEKFKRGQLKKTTTTGNKFPLGRFNSVQIARAINLFNNNPTLKGYLGLKQTQKVQTLQGYGATSVVVQAYNPAEVENDQDQQQIEQRANFGVNVQSTRGSR